MAWLVQGKHLAGIGIDEAKHWFIFNADIILV